MAKEMTQEKFVRNLRMLAEMHSNGQSGLARDLGVSAQYICDILKGRREPGEKILKPLGYRRRVVIERLPNSDESGSQT